MILTLMLGDDVDNNDADDDKDIDYYYAVVAISPMSTMMEFTRTAAPEKKCDFFQVNLPLRKHWQVKNQIFLIASLTLLKCRFASLQPDDPGGSREEGAEEADAQGGVQAQDGEGHPLEGYNTICKYTCFSHILIISTTVIKMS